MNESDIWSVDRIAANNLQVSLGLRLDAAQVETIASHFAEHRLDAYEWAAERSRSNIVQALESASLDLCPRNGEEWVSGFMRAEQVVLTMATQELVKAEPGKALSRGQVLRNLVRRAKSAAQAGA